MQTLPIAGKRDLHKLGPPGAEQTQVPSSTLMQTWVGVHFLWWGGYSLKAELYSFGISIHLHIASILRKDSAFHIHWSETFSLSLQLTEELIISM